MKNPINTIKKLQKGVNKIPMEKKLNWTFVLTNG